MISLMGYNTISESHSGTVTKRQNIINMLNSEGYLVEEYVPASITVKLSENFSIDERSLVLKYGDMYFQNLEAFQGNELTLYEGTLIKNYTHLGGVLGTSPSVGEKTWSYSWVS